MARRNAASGHRPIPVSASGVIFEEKIVPNGVGTGSPPAKSLPPRTVWQSLQLPMAAKSRPRLTRAASNDCGTGGSIAAIAGRHAIAKAATAPPITSAAGTLPIIRDFVIHPDSFLCGSFLVLLLAHIRGQRACRAFLAGHNLEMSTSRTKPFFGLKCYKNTTHAKMIPSFFACSKESECRAEITQTVTKSERPHEMRARFGVPNPLRAQVSSTRSAGRIHVGHSNFRYQTRRSVRRLAPRDPQRIAAAPLEHQCSDSRTMTTPVGSGSWGFRLVRVASLQLARLTISPV